MAKCVRTEEYAAILAIKPLDTGKFPTEGRGEGSARARARVGGSDVCCTIMSRIRVSYGVGLGLSLRCGPMYLREKVTSAFKNAATVSVKAVHGLGWRRDRCGGQVSGDVSCTTFLQILP